MDRVMGRVQRILQTREKGKPRIALDQGEFIEGRGLAGDRLFDLKPEIPVLAVDQRRRLDEAEDEGLCFRRFVETLSVSLEGGLPKAGERLKIGQALFEVSTRRKSCFSECLLVKEKKDCPLREGVVYLKVIASGRVAVGSDIIHLGEETHDQGHGPGKNLSHRQEGNEEEGSSQEDR